MDRLREPKLNIIGVDVAMFDTAGTLVGGALIARYYNKPWYYGMLAFPAGVVAHELFNQPTPMNTKIKSIIKFE